MTAPLHFGYPWWLSYGHLALAGPLLLLFAIGYRRRWSRWVLWPLGAVVLWSAAAFGVARFVLDFNGRASLPAQAFFPSGEGRVLDIGAGTGRSSIMVLEARPRATLVALDQFGESYEHHFGPGEAPEARLMANLKAAGVDGRASIRAGDMRKLPFGSGEFDAIVSAYAIDHLNRDGIRQSLAEAARVLRPQGDFLLMVIGMDPWLHFAFGPVFGHFSARQAPWWNGQLQQAGFQIIEHGMRPATLYVLARKPRSTAMR